MFTANPWPLLRSGRFDEGLRLIEQSYPSNPSASFIIGRGVAFLWAGDYQAASVHFMNAVQTYPRTVSTFYSMAGVAKWCQGDAEEAVNLWNSGLDSEFSDPAKLRLPLLLWSASVIQPHVFLRSRAEEILRSTLDDPRTLIWPGPIAKRVMGHIDFAQVRIQWTAKNETETTLRRWFAEFYEGLMSFAGGDVAGYNDVMRKSADTARPEWSGEKPFLGLLWHEEFYIARHESGESI